MTYNSLLQMDSQSIAGFFKYGKYFDASTHQFVTVMFIRQNTNPKTGDLVGQAFSWLSQPNARLSAMTTPLSVAIEASLTTITSSLGSTSVDERVIVLSAMSGSWKVRNVGITRAKRTGLPSIQASFGRAPQRTLVGLRPAQKKSTSFYGGA